MRGDLLDDEGGGRRSPCRERRGLPVPPRAHVGLHVGTNATSGVVRPGRLVAPWKRSSVAPLKTTSVLGRPGPRQGTVRYFHFANNELDYERKMAGSQPSQHRNLLNLKMTHEMDAFVLQFVLSRQLQRYA